MSDSDQQPIHDIEKKIVSINLPHRQKLLNELQQLEVNVPNVDIEKVNQFVSEWDDLGQPLTEEESLHKEFSALTLKIRTEVNKHLSDVQSTKEGIADIISQAQKIQRNEITKEIVEEWSKVAQKFAAVSSVAEEILVEKFGKLSLKVEDKIRAFEHEEKIKELERLCQELESLKTQSDLVLSQKQQKFHKIKNEFKELNLHTGKNVSKLREQYSRLVNIIQQEIGWERWGGSKRKEMLVTKMDALLNDADEVELYKKLQAMQKEWKEVGYTSKEDDKLWSNFKELSDKVYERIVKIHKNVDEEKVKLLEGVKSLSDSDVSKNNTEKMQEIQTQWYKLPKPFKKKQYEIEKSFTLACKTYFDKRRDFFKQSKEKQGSNLIEKEKLIEQAERICKNGDWKDQMPKIKNLQEEFKKLGPAPKNKNQQVWEKFQSICSPIFEQKRAQDEVENAELSGHFKEAEQILLKMEEQLNEGDLVIAANEINRLEKSLNEVGELPRNKKRFVESKKQKILKDLDRKEIDQALEKKNNLIEASLKKAQLCIKAENYLDSEDWPLASELLDNIKSEWAQIGGCSQEKQIKKRWKQCLQYLEQGNKEKDSKVIRELQLKNIKELELLCVKMENCAGIKQENISPEIQKQLMVNELQAKMGKSKSMSPLEEVASIQEQINLMGPIHADERAKFEERIDKAKNAVKTKRK
jgi:hypothetical protein